MTQTSPRRPTTFAQYLYRLLFQPKQQEQELRNREVVGTILLAGTIVTMGMLCLLLLVSYTLGGNTYVLGRLGIAVAILVFLIGIYWLSRRGNYAVMSGLLAPFYGLLALAIVWQWGINTPFGVLIFSLSIVLAGILIGPAYALVTSLLSGAAMLIMQGLLRAGIHHPATGAATPASGFGDAIGYCIGFGILGLTSWLFGQRMIQSLHRALNAEAALRREKETLEQRVDERTAELRDIQIAEMQHMYRFAELGQLSTGVLHELANYLTALTIDIEGVKSKQHSEALSRARQVTAYLDEMVDRARHQIQDISVSEPFNMADEVTAVVELLGKQAGDAHVELVWQQPEATAKYVCKGDSSRFRQIVTVLVANAIDAYYTLPRHKRGTRVVRISLERSATHIALRICDFGIGISSSQRAHLFEPFKSTKERGMGVGLAIAKQVIETHFNGRIYLSNTTDYTEFVVELPPCK